MASDVEFDLPSTERSVGEEVALRSVNTFALLVDAWKKAVSSTRTRSKCDEASFMCGYCVFCGRQALRPEA